jgi:hypothetical protein
VKNDNFWESFARKHSSLLDVLDDEMHLMFEMTLREPEYFDYQAYLQSEHWQSLREQKLEEAEHKCQVCNSREHLNVHHRTYRDLGNEKLNDLTVLCKRCHEAFHSLVELKLGEALRQKRWARMSDLLKKQAALRIATNIICAAIRTNPSCVEAIDLEALSRRTVEIACDIYAKGFKELSEE